MLKKIIPVIAFLATLPACTGGKPDATPAAAQQEAKITEPAAVATPSSSTDGPPGKIEGHVAFTGTPPKPKALKMKADPACAGQHKAAVYDESVITRDGNLKNVFVYVKSGLDGKKFDRSPPAPIVMDQKGCQYFPHVFGIMTGQTIQIKNSDPTLHNVHSLAKGNENFNVGMATKGQVIEKTFLKPETMIRVKCDVHGWMASYIGVMEHPFFAVSGDSGRFSLPPIPAGTYTLEAWHETLGTKTMEVTIASGLSADVKFTF